MQTHTKETDENPQPASAPGALLGECTHDDVVEMLSGQDPETGNDIAGWIECKYCGKVLLP